MRKRRLHAFYPVHPAIPSEFLLGVSAPWRFPFLLLPIRVRALQSDSKILLWAQNRARYELFEYDSKR